MYAEFSSFACLWQLKPFIHSVAGALVPVRALGDAQLLLVADVVLVPGRALVLGLGLALAAAETVSQLSLSPARLVGL